MLSRLPWKNELPHWLLHAVFASKKSMTVARSLNEFNCHFITIIISDLMGFFHSLLLQFPWAISFQWLAVFVVHITVYCDVMISSEFVCGTNTMLHTQTKRSLNVMCDLGGRSNYSFFWCIFTPSIVNLRACMSMQLNSPNCSGFTNVSCL